MSTFKCIQCKEDCPTPEMVPQQFARKLGDELVVMNYEICSTCFINGGATKARMDELWENFVKWKEENNA